MSLTKYEILYYDYNTNTLDVIINGEKKTVKLSTTRMGCITDNIIGCLEERGYVEL
jgi:hypothetical protein